jgi:outer membrane lipoprotein carrier protein
MRPWLSGILLPCLLLLATAAWAQSALEAFNKSVNTLSGRFWQEDGTGHAVQRQSGRFWLDRQRGALRWEVDQPDKQVIVVDQGRVYHLDTEVAQLTIAPLDQSLSKTPAMLLARRDAVMQGFTVQSKDTNWFRLIPKEPGEFSAVNLLFQGLQPVQMELTWTHGDISRIGFEAVRVNEAIPPKTFRLDPPPGVDVVGP